MRAVWCCFALACGTAEVAPDAAPAPAADAPAADAPATDAPAADAPAADAPADPAVPPPTLDELLVRTADRFDSGHPEEALGAWRAAYAQYQTEVAPLAAARCGWECGVDLEYRFGRLRAALDAPRGKPRPLADALVTRIAEVRALPPPPPPPASAP